MAVDSSYINKVLEHLGYKLDIKPSGNGNRLRLSKIGSELGDMFGDEGLVIIVKKGSVEVYSPPAD